MSQVKQPLIPTTIPARFLSYVRKRGGDADSLIREFDLPPAVEKQPFVVLPLRAIVLFTDAAARLLDDPLIGLHAAEQGSSEMLNVLAFACSGVATLGEAVDRLIKYVSTVHDALVMSWHPTATGAVLRQSIPGEPQCLGWQGNEHWTASILFAARRISAGNWSPSRVWLAHSASRNQEALVHAFGTPNVSFMAGSNAIEVDRHVLTQPLRLSAPGVSTILRRYDARSPTPRTDVSDFQRHVRVAVEDRLSSGPPLIQDVARAVRTSARTLQRRLTEEGLTFQELLDEVRRDVSIRHVEETALPLSTIAQRVGYSQQSAFFRSFRRWTGTTPARARQDAGAPRSDRPAVSRSNTEGTRSGSASLKS